MTLIRYYMILVPYKHVGAPYIGNFVREEKLEPGNILIRISSGRLHNPPTYLYAMALVAYRPIVSLLSCGGESLGPKASIPYSSRWPAVTIQDTTVTGQRNANWL